jgi:ABC-type lipoprotein release transport system permease subunit
MTGSTLLTYALRSLWRNPRRTLLSVLGVSVGCSIGLFASSWYGGAIDWQIRAASENGVGHLVVVNERWTKMRENTLRVRGWEAIAEVAMKDPAVKLIAPRIKAFGLLALGNRTEAIEMVGVEPDAEFESNRTLREAKKRGAFEGRYLRGGEEGVVVIGKGLAASLGAELEDLLVVTLSAKDEVQSAMLRVVGILGAGVDAVDDGFCHVGLGELQRLTGREGVGEIGILLENQEQIPTARTRLAPQMPAGCALITWGEVMTLFAMNIKSDSASIAFMIFIVMLVVGLFIMSAQHAAVLERKREFAVLSALGMKGRRVVGLVLIEGLLTGLLGALAATLMGGGLAYWLSTGIDIRKVFGDVFEAFGVLMDPIVYGSYGPWIVWYALVVCTVATVSASLLPAWKATKVDPAEALRMV